MHRINSFLQLIFVLFFINDEKNYNYYSRFWEKREKKNCAQEASLFKQCCSQCALHILIIRQVLFCYMHTLFYFIYKNAFIILSQRHNFNFFLCPFVLPLPHCTSSCCCWFFFCAAMNKWVFCFFLLTPFSLQCVISRSDPFKE